MVLGSILTATATAGSRGPVGMAGDLHASVMALHAADGGAARIVDGFAGGELEWQPDGMLEAGGIAVLGGGLPSSRPGVPNHGNARWWVERFEFEGSSGSSKRIVLWREVR